MPVTYLLTFYHDWPCAENEDVKHGCCINEILLQGGTAQGGPWLHSSAAVGAGEVWGPSLPRDHSIDTWIGVYLYQ